jgi:hypothetical protein
VGTLVTDGGLPQGARERIREHISELVVAGGPEESARNGRAAGG